MVISLFGLSGPELCNNYVSGAPPWALEPGQKLESRLVMGLKLTRQACETSARKATLHLATGAVLCLAAAQVVVALGHGSRGKEQSQKLPTIQKSNKVREGKKEAKSPCIYKKK